MQTFVSKSRRKFELTLKIQDLNNVPLVSGSCFIKWHLPSSTSAEHRGRTTKCSIKDHTVHYDYERTLPVRLVVGKDQMLQETWIHFEVLQEYSSGGKGERIVLGNIRLNLAEYVEASQHGEGGEEGVTRRYLMQDSKINSTLKIGIGMRHLEGDRNYIAPPLKTAPVFGGIAGIMSHEAPEVIDGLDQMPSLSSKSRETGELQDMYRRTLAASWAAQPGELKADDCIEDIFAGGDGSGSHLHHSRALKQQNRQSEDGSFSDEDKSRNASSTDLNAGRSSQPRSPFLRQGRKREDRPKPFQSWSRNSDRPMPGNFSGRASLQQQARKLEMEGGKEKKVLSEVNEFDNPYREDLRCWNVKSSQVA